MGSPALASEPGNGVFHPTHWSLVRPPVEPIGATLRALVADTVASPAAVVGELGSLLRALAG